MAPTGPERGQTVQAPRGPRPGGESKMKDVTAPPKQQKPRTSRNVREDRANQRETQCEALMLSLFPTEVLKSDFEKKAGVPWDPTKLLSSMSFREKLTRSPTRAQKWSLSYAV